ncbi:hypothetical protein HHK36_031177 [Tetracentron sinense]|uniref:BZIP domain-containing protein n=1 Tax=Tetracentron sinense TaxID=13715 RepID=A0A834YD23_TETSI|nr:hypothetical protein HHK36_031177 [Tetracentron sinense]
MEDVWKDINLAYLHDHPTGEELGLPRNNTFRGTILGDFLARPFNKDPPRSVNLSTPGPTTFAGDVRPFGGSPAPAPAPDTVLSLHPWPEFDTHPIRPHSQFHSYDSAATASYISSLNTPFDASASSSGFSSFYNKRVPETDGNSGERRHKCMIKNRESAARSRARKQESLSLSLSLQCETYEVDWTNDRFFLHQLLFCFRTLVNLLQAYTNELELEVAHLIEENAKLRKQQQKLHLAAAAQLPKNRTLQRTSTAPF